jgi:uncharacterized phage protein (TIGR02218 family)
MKTLDSTFANSLTNSSLTLAWCWLITRIDGLMLGFTSLDVPIAIDNVTYRPFTGFDAGAAQISEGVEKLDSQTLTGILDVSGISKADLQSGIYERAEVRRFLIDYSNLPSSLNLTPPKHLELPRGYLAETKRNNLGYELKVKDDLSLLDNQIGQTTSMTCRANLGDDKCRKNLTAFTHAVTITAITDNRIFSISGGKPDGYFDKGRIKFTSGLNNGIHRDVGFYAQNKIILYQPLPFPVAVGDALTAVAGCLKTELACITKFQNFANFVGEPDVPTTDLAVNTPSR